MPEILATGGITASYTCAGDRVEACGKAWWFRDARFARSSTTGVCGRR
jgi:hypothetical protein